MYDFVGQKKAEAEIVHTPEEYDFPDSLYQDHWENAQAWGVVGDSGNLLACIERGMSRGMVKQAYGDRIVGGGCAPQSGNREKADG